MENIPEKVQSKFVKWFYVGSVLVLPVIFILSGVVKKNPCSSVYSSAMLAVFALLLLAGISAFVVVCFEIVRIIKNKNIISILIPVLFFIIQIIFIGFILVVFLNQSLAGCSSAKTIDIPTIDMGARDVK